MENYSIKITGGGFKEEIIESLKTILRDMEVVNNLEEINGWEDPYLYVDVTED